MSADFDRLLGWGATLHDMTVTALLAWMLVLLLASQAAASEEMHFRSPNQTAAVTHDLGFVGMATPPDPALRAQVIAPSAAVVPARPV